MAPTLVASYNLVTSAVDTSTLTTASFTPGAGEVIVVKAATWDASQPMGTPSGGGLTYTSRAASTSGGFRPWVGIWTAVVSGSPGAMTVSCTPTVSSWHNMVVERWSGAQLAATPVTDATQGGTGSASSTLTTSAADSVISWVAGDAQSLNPATRAYLSSGTVTEELVDDQHASTNGVWYYARQTVASAGSTTYGLSAPTGMQWWIAGVEILAAGGGATPISVGDAGSEAEALAVAAASPVTDSGSASQSLTVAAAAGLGDGGSAADSLAVVAMLTLSDAGAAADGVDNGLGISKALSDGGSALDALSVAAAIQLADTASAGQSFGVAAFVSLADMAAAAEVLTIPARTLQFADGGTASESFGAVAVVSLADTGSAVDGATGADGSNIARSLADSGSARDWLHARAQRPKTGTTSRPSTGVTVRPDTGITYRP